MEKLKTINIQGKEYVDVSERVKYFNATYTNGSIVTNLIKDQDGVVIMRTTVCPDSSKPERVFTGTAYEKENANFINKTSYIENCETSAVGRALGMMGIGIESSIASADEVKNAIDNQKPKPQPKAPTRVVDNLQDIEPPIQEPSFVEESLATANIEPSSASETPSNTLTSGQFKFILDLWRNKGKHEAELKEEVVKLFGKELDQITKSEASKFIDQIKSL